MLRRAIQKNLALTPLRVQLTRQAHTSSRFIPKWSAQNDASLQYDFLKAFAAGTIAGMVLSVAKPSHHPVYTEPAVAQNDQSLGFATTTTVQQGQMPNSWVEPGVFIWGNNRHGIVDPTSAELSIRSPQRLSFFNQKILRDLAFAETHAAAIDSNGNVYQWGFGYSGNPSEGFDVSMPEMTIKGKDIVQVALSDSKIYALSSGGKVYVMPASREHQLSHPHATTSSSSLAKWWPFGSESEGRHIAVLDTSRLSRGERITSLAAGPHHILATTTSGRLLSSPADSKGNEYGQLGLSHTEPVGGDWCLELFEIHVGRGIKTVEVAAGDGHSVVRTDDGHVFGFGANSWGQLAQGDYKEGTAVLPFPTEITFPSRDNFPKHSRCVHIAAGGNNSYFVIDRGITEVYACGLGQWGALGNGNWNQVMGYPALVKGMSGLTEFNESLNKSVPIRIHDLVAGSTHALAVLENIIDHDNKMPICGRDVFAWGQNFDSQLNNAKKNNISIPIRPLPLESQKGLLQLAPEPRKGESNFTKQKVRAGAGVTAVYSAV